MTDIAYYQRNLARALEHRWNLAPTTRDACPVLCHAFETDRARYQAWLLDALHTAFSDLAAGDVKLANRGLMLAKEYVGRIGWAGSIESDAMTALQNEIERRVFK